MLNQKTIKLAAHFEDLLITNGCDGCLADMQGQYDTANYSLREIQQAWACACCNAARAFIANCYDTPDADVGNARSKYLTPAHYAEWLHRQLTSPIMELPTHQSPAEVRSVDNVDEEVAKPKKQKQKTIKEQAITALRERGWREDRWGNYEHPGVPFKVYLGRKFGIRYGARRSASRPIELKRLLTIIDL